MDTSTRQIVRVGRAEDEGSTGGGRVLVGISGAPVAEQRDCLDFAVAEANRRHADLWLVHGCDPLVTVTALVPTSTLQKRFRAGREIVRAAVDEVIGDLDPKRGITTEVAEVSGAQALVDLSVRASLVVCQRRTVSAARRWHTGSTTSRVCAQSEAPVAVVTSGAGQRSGSGVVVGVDGHGHSAVAVAAALVEATLREQELTAVHAWEAPGPPGTTGYIPPDHDELEMLSGRAKHLLAAVMAGPCADHDDVTVHQVAIRGPAAEALLYVSRTAQLLIVGRHAGHGVASLGLGGVARHVLDRSPCPVIVTPPSRRSRRHVSSTGDAGAVASAGPG